MSTENQKGAKGPITLKIKFKSSSIEQFIERYSVDVSRGGIFIRTKEPLAVGTILRFEFQLQDGTPLISGDGTVVWNRANNPTRQNVAPGMGVRFDKLTPDSQRVLERILSDKEKRGDTQLESRFDAGVRAMQGGGDAPTTSSATPQNNGNNMFGDEPTRAMAANQVNKLAEAMQRGGVEEDAPTRAAAKSELSDEVRKLTGPTGDGSGSLPAIPMGNVPMPGKMEPMRQANPMVRSTLLGQGFGLKPGPIPTPAGLIQPGTGPTPSGTMGRPETSLPSMTIEPPQSMDSAVTPVKSHEADQIADSQRTPDRAAAAAAQSAANDGSQASAATPAKQEGASVDVSGPSAVAVEQPVSEAPRADIGSLETARPSGTRPGQSGGSKGLMIGAVVLIVVVAAAGYFVLVGQRQQPVEPKPTPVEATPTPPPPPPRPLELTPEKGATEAGKTEPGKTEPGKTDATNPPPGDGIEIVSDPPGAQIELAGKAAGVTPTKLPAVGAGKIYDLKLTLRGYQELRQKIKATEDNKPIQLKLVPVERQVVLVSVPKGADVLVDGKKIGRTPWIIRKIDLSKPVTIELRRAGFEPWTRTVSDTESFVLANKKEVLTLSATLEPAAGKKAAKPAKKVDEPAAPAGEKQIPPAEPAKPAADSPKQADPAPEPAKPAADSPKQADPAADSPKQADPAKP